MILSPKKKYERSTSIFNEINSNKKNFSDKKFNFNDRNNLFETARRQTLEREQNRIEYLKMKEKEKRELRLKRIYQGNILYDRVVIKKTKFERIENLKRENLEVFKRKKLLNNLFGHCDSENDDEYLLKTKIIIENENENSINKIFPIYKTKSLFENQYIKFKLLDRNGNYHKYSRNYHNYNNNFNYTERNDNNSFKVLFCDKINNRNNKNQNERYKNNYDNTENNILNKNYSNFNYEKKNNGFSFNYRPKNKNKIFIKLNKTLFL